MKRRLFMKYLMSAPVIGSAISPSKGAAMQAKPGTQKHIIVIGAGAFGGWSALNLVRKGVRVTLIDAIEAGNPLPVPAAKPGSSGMLTNNVFMLIWWFAPCKCGRKMTVAGVHVYSIKRACCSWGRSATLLMPR